MYGGRPLPSRYLLGEGASVDRLNLRSRMRLRARNDALSDFLIKRVKFLPFHDHSNDTTLEELLPLRTKLFLETFRLVTNCQ